MTGSLAEGSNRRFSHTVTTTAERAAIWRLWMDVPSWKEWDDGLKDAECTGPLSLGSQGRITPKSGTNAAFEITEFSPGEAYALTTKLPFARLVVRRAFEISEHTQFKHDVWFDGPFAGIWAALLGPGFRKALPPTMQKLADLAE